MDSEDLEPDFSEVDFRNQDGLGNIIPFYDRKEMYAKAKKEHQQSDCCL